MTKILFFRSYNLVSEKLASVTGRYERESQEIIQLHDLAQLATSGVLSESKEIGYMNRYIITWILYQFFMYSDKVFARC